MDKDVITTWGNSGKGNSHDAMKEKEGDLVL